MKPFSWNLCIAVAAVLLACLAPVSAATVTGTIDHPAIFWITQGAQNKSSEFEMRNKDRQFLPALLVIHATDSVRFPNDDPFYHSIYSVTNADPFDIGYYGTGPGKLVTFDRSGVIDVHCHIHPGMHAVIVVADGPATSSPLNKFSLSGITEGKHVLHIWTDGASVRSIDIIVAAQSQTLDLGNLTDRR